MLRAHRTRLLQLTLAAVAVFVLLTSCGQDDADPASSETTETTTTTVAGPELQGTPWTLDTVSVTGSSTAAVGGVAATLDFGAAGKLSGSTGCNNFNGTWEAGPTADSLALTVGPSTMRGCTDPALSAQEEAILGGLPEVTSYVIEAGALELRDEAGTPLLSYTAESTDLTGTGWSATGVNNGRDAVVGIAEADTITAEFGDGGQLTGSGGCNTFSATWSTDGSSITISTPASTKETCGTEVDQTEQQYFAALANATTFERSGNTLTLRDATGATQVSFTAAS